MLVMVVTPVASLAVPIAVVLMMPVVIIPVVIPMVIIGWSSSAMAVSEVPTTDPITARAKNNFFMGIETLEEKLLFGMTPFPRRQ